jgi:hypothetical protein
MGVSNLVVQPQDWDERGKGGDADLDGGWRTARRKEVDDTGRAPPLELGLV